jgi:hypothetical protein
VFFEIVYFTPQSYCIIIYNTLIISVTFFFQVYFLENEDKILNFIKDKKLARSQALAEVLML